MVKGGPDRGRLVARVLELNYGEREAVHEDDDVRAAVVPVLDDSELVNGKPVVVAGLVEVEEGSIDVHYPAVRIAVLDRDAVCEQFVEGAVVLDRISIPALKVRRAETVVELPSGGSLVIAGLLSDQSRQAISGYPGLKNLPVIGALFRSRDFQKRETELVIVVTPFVVKPVARSQLAMPDDGFAWASDVNSDLLGQMNRIYGRAPERAPVGQFVGDGGLIVE